MREIKIRIRSLNPHYFEKKMGIKGKAILSVDYEVIKHSPTDSTSVDILKIIEEALSKDYEVEIT